jgi:hypothetical protein
MKKYAVAVIIIFIGLITSSLAAGDDKLPQLSAADIINKHLAAAGGKEGLAKFKTRAAIGTVQKENSAAVPFAIVSEAPNRVSANFQFADPAVWQLTYDAGKVVFRPQFGRGVAQIEQKYREMVSSGTLFNGISLYNVLLQGDESGIKYEAKGTKKLKDRLAYIVDAKRGKDLDVRLYFDAETFMWVRTDYGHITVTRPMGRLTNDASSKDQETTYDFYVETSNFKDVDGVKLPFRVEIVLTRPLLRQKESGVIVGNISEYRHNIPIAPDMYQ